MTAVLVVGGFAQPVGTVVRTVEAAAPPAFVAPAGGTISGQVTDDRGAPLTGVSVQVQGASVQYLQTGADGRYMASALIAGSYRVLVDTGVSSPPTYSPLVPYPELIDVSSTLGQTGVDFTVPRPAIVAGFVRNQGGIGVPNAVIGGLNAYTVAGPDGHYVGTATGGAHTVGAGAPGYVGWNGLGFSNLVTPITTAPGQVTSVDFTLDAGGAISGRVVDTDGVPVAGAYVSAYQPDVVGYSYASTPTDQSGNYQLDALAAGSYVVSSSAPGGDTVYFPGTIDVNSAGRVSVLDGATTPGIDFTLPVALPLGPPITVTAIAPMVFRRGTTTTATLTGTGFIVGGSVHVDRFGPGPGPSVSFISVVDSEHLLVSVTVPPDAMLGNDGGLYFTQRGQPAEFDGGPFVADATSVFGTISGHVTKTSDGTPIANVRVYADQVGGPQSVLSTMSLPDGSYLLGPLQPGDYAVRFSPVINPDLASEYYLDAKSDVTSTPVTVVADADAPNIDAALEAADVPIITAVSPSVVTAGTTTDVVVTGTGFGVDDTFFINTGAYWQGAPQVVAKRIVSSTEADVSIKVDPLTPSGPIAIEAPPRGGGVINECHCMSIAMSPETTGTVVGSVIDPSGSGLGSIHVTALADGQTQPTSAGWTTTAGTYALRLPAGTYTLHFEDLGGAAVDAPGITVTVGQITQAVDATITPLAFLGGLSGSVTDVATGLPISHALVQFTNATTGETGAVMADAGGSYHFSTLPVGDYTVEISAPGYDSRWYADALTAGAAAPVSVVAGIVTSSINAALPPARRPLSVSSIQPNRMAVGETLANVVVTGAGFVIGNVANLSFSAGDGVAITAAQAASDTSATLSLAIDPAAAIGPRDIVATRDDGQQVTCRGCLRIFSALGSISGTVSLSSSTPSLINVTATSMTTGERFNVSVGSGGPWTLDRIPAGDYTVGFSAYGYVDQWYNNAASLATATPITVGSSPIVGIDAVLQAARKYLGLWSSSPYSVEQGSQTTVTLSGQGFLDGGVTGLTIDAGVGTTVQSISVSSDSSATATLTVASDAPLGTHVMKISRDDGTTSTCTTCLVVLPPPGRITGHVTGTNGLPYGWVDAFVAGNPFPIAAVSVQPDGSYTLDHLTPGDYQVEFGGYTLSFQSYTPEWWNDAPTQASATTITVGTGQTVTAIDAQLSVPASPLALYPGYSYPAYQGTANSVSLYGGGFLNGVTGLTFSAGPGVSIAVSSIDTDSIANVTITTDPGAAPGPRDLVVTRDDGQSATCTGCINVVVAPPGTVSALVLDADTSNYVSGTATLTKVGDAVPTWSQSFYASLYATGLAAGDYDLNIDALGYQSSVTRVTVIAGQTVYLPNILMQAVRQPLSFTGPSPLSVYQGFPQQFTVSGTGFHSGAVTGLSFDGGPDVTITVDAVFGDTAAAITVAASATAAAGARDLTITRDDGQIAVCTGCLIVSPPAPGSISGTVQSSDSYSYLPTTITVTAVGASAPTNISFFSGPYSIGGLAAGDYDVLFESPGYTSLTQRLTVRPGQDTFTYTYLDLPRQPLTITSVYPNVVDTGSYYAQLQVNGSGFRAGGVTGLSVSLGPNVLVQSIYIGSDSLAYVYVTVPQEAPLGGYDVVVGRDPGETATCSGCVTVQKPPGFVYGTVADATCCTSFLATVTATKVGDTVPTATASTYGYYGMQLPEGDYIIRVDADGYASQWWNHAASEVDATPVSVASGAYQYGIDFALTAVRAPLTIAYVAPAETYQGETHFLTVVGSGFLRGGVTALSFGGGSGVDATVVAIYSDSEAVVGFGAADYAALGTRDVTATRDDGQTATCASCLSVLRGQPYVSGVSPSVVREGTRTLTLSGVRMQRVVRVTTSSRKVTVQSMKNNRDGTITVRVKIDSGARKTYTLTFTRDDGTTFTAYFSVR